MPLTAAQRQKAYRERAAAALRNVKAAAVPPLVAEIGTAQTAEIARLQDELAAARAAIRRLKARHRLAARHARRHVT